MRKKTFKRKLSIALAVASIVALPMFSTVANAKCYYQPKMKGALNELLTIQRNLKTAETHLKKASKNKHGHRVQALKHVSLAKQQIELASRNIKTGCHKATSSQQRKNRGYNNKKNSYYKSKPTQQRNNYYKINQLNSVTTVATLLIGVLNSSKIKSNQLNSVTTVTTVIIGVLNSSKEEDKLKLSSTLHKNKKPVSSHHLSLELSPKFHF